MIIAHPEKKTPSERNLLVITEILHVNDVVSQFCSIILWDALRTKPTQTRTMDYSIGKNENKENDDDNNNDEVTHITLFQRIVSTKPVIAN